MSHAIEQSPPSDAEAAPLRKYTVDMVRLRQIYERATVTVMARDQSHAEDVADAAVDEQEIIWSVSDDDTIRLDYEVYEAADHHVITQKGC